MSGDVQPRKRKDKKKKKDDLSIEEPRGTAATLGEGDVFMHSYHDHGTGGHWCAKIIFFSLLAVLITLVGLIILENRGLTELEANSVESRYSGVLEGWIEDSHDDDHHDEHTLELKHHGQDLYHKEVDDKDEGLDSVEELDNIEDDEDETEDHDDDDNEDEDHDDDDNEDEDHDDDDNEDEDHDDDEDEDHENNSEEADEQYDDDHNDDYNDDDKETNYESEENKYDLEQTKEDNYEEDDGEKNDDDDEEDDDDGGGDDNEDLDHDIPDNDGSNEDEDEHEHEDGVNEDEEVEIERIEREITDDVVSAETQFEQESHEDNAADALKAEEDDTSKAEESIEDNDDFLEADDDSDEPPIEIITAPSGAAFDEIEEKTVFEKPPDTLAEEEEYEKRQEELRREVSDTSHLWLKMVIGAALLVATHAVLRRFTAPRDDPEEENEEVSLGDRRMTLIPEEPVIRSAQGSAQNVPPQQKVHEKETVQTPIDVDFALPQKTDTKEADSKNDSIKKEESTREEIKGVNKDKELYSDEEETEDEEQEAEVPKPQNKPVLLSKSEELEPDEVEDDVEIIDEEQEDEELEDEEEEISDVDDTELLSRLEAKYGRLPEPERPGRQKDGGNSIEDLWPGEPSEARWRRELDRAEDELRQGEWEACERRVGVAALADSARARWLLASALDMGAERKRDNRLLSRAITAYLHLLKMNERLSDKRLLEIAQRTIDRIMFRGTYSSAEPVYRLLIRRFPSDVGYRNNLTISFLMSNRADLAEEVLKETLKLWPNDRVALAHHGFVLKNEHNKLEEAVTALQKALEGDTGPANEPRFYYHLGDALLLLGRFEEAHEVHKRGAALGHFLSPAQRSLYNVPRLKSRPWWKIEDTPYINLARALEKSWKEILKEGEAAKELYEKEKEGLKERGEWSQMDLFVQGREVPGRCARAPVTCSVVRAASCRRGQVKFSAMAAGTHVRAHVGPTNCRLRMHLGLANTQHTYIRVGNETRQWQTGKVLMFDDSFEHEVWHNGTGTRLVLIVDVWHPDLTPAERRRLPAI